jgi:hypothetical protein
MKKIMLLPSDVPNKIQLQHAVSRLTKDYDLLKKLRGKNDTEDPKAMIATASFLDMLVRRESRNLEKGEIVGDMHVVSVKERFITYLLSLPKEEAYNLILTLKEQLDAQDILNI